MECSSPRTGTSSSLVVTAHGVERQLLSVLGELARTLGTPFELQDVLDHLTQRIVEVLPISAAGVTLIVSGARPQYIAASDDSALRFERLQSELDEGPCLMSCRTGEAVSVPDLREDHRFPRFGPMAVAEGLVAVFAIPLRYGSERLGALDLYRTSAGPLEAEAMSAAQTLADVAAAYLLNAWARVELEEVTQDARQSSLHDAHSVEALRASEARKAAILDSALDAVITTDEHGTVVEFNPAAQRTFGYTEEEALGRDLGDLIVPPEDRAAYQRGRDLGVNKLMGQRTEVAAMRADGSLFPAEVSVSAVEAPGARLFTGFFRDLSDQAAADARRGALEERLQQTERLESLGRLAGGVAHDFNNLLTVILGYASVIAERAADGDVMRANAEQIISAAERAARLAQQLLTFAHRYPVHHEPVDLNAIVAELHGLLFASIGDHIDLVVKAGPCLPQILADRGQTEQVLVNLVLNARDAMAEGGTLMIETEVTDLDATFASAHPGVSPGRFVRLSVSDTGTGMSPEVVARAFDPFVTTKPRDQGSGLGLSIVYGIVTDAGGIVDLTSDEGIGTMVRVYLPATDALPVTTPPVECAAIEGTAERVLVVEDHPEVLELTASILRRHGYLVLVAASAREAIALAADHELDLLLTDLVMPELSGTDLAEALEGPATSHRVLYMSGYSADVLGAEPDTDKTVNMLHKPFTEGALLEAVHRALLEPSPGASRR